MDAGFIASVRSSFQGVGDEITLGAPVRDRECLAEPLVKIPLSMLNRHGLVTGATGTGKTKTLQLLAEQISAAGAPVFVADLKGDLSGLAAPGEADQKLLSRAHETGYSWTSSRVPVEFMSLTGGRGATLRATINSFGPLLMAKVLSLNDTQASVLALVFKYASDKALALDDLADLRAVLLHLVGGGAKELVAYGGVPAATVNVLLRKMTEMEQQGLDAFFGQPEFDLRDLLAVRDGCGVVSVLELADVQERPALFSTFMAWMLLRLLALLPEAGDMEKPRLVFFFDEAHLLFDHAAKALLDEVERTVRLIRSKGVGVFFVTQSPKDVPPDVLAQLGHRVQHALRAFTADDEKALRAAARTLPKTTWYDVEGTMTTLAIGEALVSVLGPTGVPNPPVATRLLPPRSRMAPLHDDEMATLLAASSQVRRYAERVRGRGAASVLVNAPASEPPPAPPAPEPVPEEERRAPLSSGVFERFLKSPVAKQVTTGITKRVLDILLGPAPRKPSSRKRR